MGKKTIFDMSREVSREQRSQYRVNKKTGQLEFEPSELPVMPVKMELPLEEPGKLAHPTKYCGRTHPTKYCGPFEVELRELKGLARKHLQPPGLKLTTCEGIIMRTLEIGFYIILKTYLPHLDETSRVTVNPTTITNEFGRWASQINVIFPQDRFGLAGEVVRLYVSFAETSPTFTAVEFSWLTRRIESEEELQFLKDVISANLVPGPAEENAVGWPGLGSSLDEFLPKREVKKPRVVVLKRSNAPWKLED